MAGGAAPGGRGNDFRNPHAIGDSTKQKILARSSLLDVRILVCLAILWPIPVPRLRGHGDPAPSGGPPAASATCASSGLPPSGFLLLAMTMVYGATLPRPPGIPGSETRRLLLLAAYSRSGLATRGLLWHGIAQRTPVPPGLPITPVVKNSRSTGRVGLAPARLHTALTRLCTVEKATSTLSPGTARTASGAAHILLVTHCAVMYFSLRDVPPSRLPRTSHPRAVRPYRGMPCMPSAMTISAGISPRRCGACSCRAADERSARSAASASHVRIATRAHSAVGTLSTTAAN